MASTPGITVTIERAMHDGLRDLAQKLYDQHGVKLNTANISWYDIGTIGAPRVIVAAIRVDSETTQAPNDRVEGRDAALSRRVPSHDGLCPDGGEK